MEMSREKYHFLDTTVHHSNDDDIWMDFCYKPPTAIFLSTITPHTQNIVEQAYHTGSCSIYAAYVAERRIFSNIVG